jgi:ferrous iron transport protein A
MTARVRAITMHDEETERLEEMGLTEGTEFKVIKIAPFGDPIEIELRGYRLCLRKRETSGFEIELIS